MILFAANEAIALIHEFAAPVPRPLRPPVPRAAAIRRQGACLSATYGRRFRYVHLGAN
jgi:hypothetical protein